LRRWFEDILLENPLLFAGCCAQAKAQTALLNMVGPVTTACQTRFGHLQSMKIAQFTLCSGAQFKRRSAMALIAVSFFLRSPLKYARLVNVL